MQSGMQGNQLCVSRDANKVLQGVPMFVSFSVASGRDLVRGRGVCRVSRILELEGKMKDVYVTVFGQEHYNRYPNAIESSPDFVEYKETTLFKHERWMESESFLWVLAHGLMTSLAER